MVGRGLLTKIIVTLCGCLFATSVAAAGGRGPIAVLLSDDEAYYRQPANSFIASAARPVKEFNLNGDIERAPQIMAEILSLDPSLIFTLGAKATYSAKIWTKDRPQLPVLFAMVINWQRYDFTGNQNMAGIAYNILPGTQLMGLTIFAPQIKKVGVIYNSEQSAEYIAKARKTAKMLDIELVAAEIDRSEDFQRKYKQLAPQVEALWIIPDPVTYTIDNISWVEKRCLQDNLLCMGHSKNIVVSNLVLAVDPDITNIGSQAAGMADDILSGAITPKQMGVVEPLGTRIILNMRTAQKLGVRPCPEALNLATEIIQ